MYEDINVILLDMDVKIPEQVTKNTDGSYTIFLNARLSYENQLRSYEHALKHIKNEDFEQEFGNVQAIETVAHELAKQSKPQPLPADKYIRKILQIQRSRKRIQKELKKIEERNAWLAENDPELFDRMSEYNLERQRFGDI